MRTQVKYRLYFLVVAIVCYYLGVNFIPDNNVTQNDFIAIVVVSCSYFLFLPFLYWYCIIHKGKQKLWKLVMIFGLSSTVARFSYTSQFINYFEFVMWLRYPIIAIILAFELYLTISIIRALWQVRKLPGDPRISCLNKYHDEKKQTLAITLATEPANWYYAIPYFSRNHCHAIAQLTLISARRWHCAFILSVLIIAAFASYKLLINWNEIAAIGVSGFILYSFIIIIANHRIARNYALYTQNNSLIINNTIFNFMVIPFTAIESIKINQNNIKHKNNLDSVDDNVKVGRAKQHNIILNFNKKITYWGMNGLFVEQVKHVLLNVDNPQKFILKLESEIDKFRDPL